MCNVIELNQKEVFIVCGSGTFSNACGYVGQALGLGGSVYMHMKNLDYQYVTYIKGCSKEQFLRRASINTLIITLAMVTGHVVFTTAGYCMETALNYVYNNVKLIFT